MKPRPLPGRPARRSRLATRLAVALGLLLPVTAASETVVVGSKNFAENRLLAEAFAQLIESRTELGVDRRLNLAGTQVCFEALRTGAIDLYPEYTGTGLVSLLGEEAESDPATTLNRVRQEFLARWDLWWLAPLGFENAYEIGVRRAVAERHALATISDLARAPELDAAFGFEFTERPDGLPGLTAAYGLQFRSVRPMQQTLKYQAAGRGEVDVLDVYTTDGRLLAHDLQVLADDRGFFPSYEAAVLVRGETLRDHPEVGPVLSLLAGALDEATMRGYNLRLQEEGESPERVAADLLSDLGLGDGGAAGEPTSTGPERGLATYLWSERGALGRRTLEHLRLSLLALLLGVAVAVPLGLLLERRRRVAEAVIRATGVAQTVPSIALLAFMIPLLGIGFLPAVAALWIYSLFPILRSTYSGVRDADAAAVEAATALGMTPGQVLRTIRLPLAAPVIMAGVRTAAVITVGTATLAAFIGAGGLGEPIVTGLQLADSTVILSGALPAALLAVGVDLALGRVERAVRPRGVG